MQHFRGPSEASELAMASQGYTLGAGVVTVGAQHTNTTLALPPHSTTYYRGHKHPHKKNIGCFPHCNVVSGKHCHTSKTFCGHCIVVEVTSVARQCDDTDATTNTCNLEVLGAFSADDAPPRLCKGEKITVERLRAELRRCCETAKDEDGGDSGIGSDSDAGMAWCSGAAYYIT